MYCEHKNLLHLWIVFSYKMKTKRPSVESFHRDVRTLNVLVYLNIGWAGNNYPRKGDFLSQKFHSVTLEPSQVHYQRNVRLDCYQCDTNTVVSIRNLKIHCFWEKGKDNKVQMKKGLEKHFKHIISGRISIDFFELNFEIRLMCELWWDSDKKPWQFMSILFTWDYWIIQMLYSFSS